MIELRYPVFVPSKGRATQAMTPRFMLDEGVPFRLVVEPSEVDAYAAAFPDARLLVTPRDEMRLLGVRNFIRDVSVEEGHARHWQFDDNIRRMFRYHAGRRHPCDARFALAMVEEFTDRYTNIGISGFDYETFARGAAPPYRLNVHVYSASLVSNEMPYRWRLLYNDDTDLCLQVLAGGLCTVQFCAFLAEKGGTMKLAGGNTEDLYQGDGRLRMARELERMWPGVVRVDRRFRRPQHVVKWSRFTTPLQRREDLDWDEIEAREFPLRKVQR